MRPSMIGSIDTKYDHILGPLRPQFCAVVVLRSYIPSSLLNQFYQQTSGKCTGTPQSPGKKFLHKLFVKYLGYVLMVPAEVAIAVG